MSLMFSMKGTFVAALKNDSDLFIGLNADEFSTAATPWPHFRGSLVRVTTRSHQAPALLSEIVHYSGRVLLRPSARLVFSAFFSAADVASL
jgi:hypothetical protein